MTTLDLTGRTALVTGGSGGIGAAISVALAGSGVDVALSYARHRDDAERVADQVRGRGRRAAILEGDLADPEVPELMSAAAEKDIGPIDILVANAGIGVQRAWDEVDLELWDTTLAVNLRAPYLLARQVLPGMIERGFGRVLFMSSIAALNGGVMGPHYAASKAALHGLAHHLAPRVAPRGVTVNVLAPAVIEGTRMVPAGDWGRTPESMPVGRFGRTEEVADLTMAILRNGYLTDKVITLDGGLYPM
jgi:3-oxoacyl-[acyl-carrier protein] reductase